MLFSWCQYCDCECMLSRSAQSRPTLYECMDCSSPGFSVHGMFQARILEWVALSSSGNLPDPGIKPQSPASPAWAGRFFTTEPLGKPSILWLATTIKISILNFNTICGNYCSFVDKHLKKLYQQRAMHDIMQKRSTCAWAMKTNQTLCL